METNKKMLLNSPLEDYKIVITHDKKIKNKKGIVESMTDIFLNEIKKRYEVEIPVTSLDSIGDGPHITVDFDRQSSFTLGEYRIFFGNQSIKIECGSLCGLYAGFIRIIDAIDIGIEEGTSEEQNIRNTILRDQPFARQSDGTVRIITSNMLFAIERVVPSGILIDETRCELLGELYMLFSPDLIGLQEALETNVYMVSPVIGRDYDFVPYNMLHSGEKLAYRKDRYELKDHNIVDLGSTYAFAWALLKDKNSGEMLIFGSVHYHFRGDDWRIPQAQTVNAELKRLAKMYPNTPILVTGDYNSFLGSPVHNEMIKDMNMASAVTVAPEDKRDIEALTFHDMDIYRPIAHDGDIQLDHVMVTLDTVEVKYHKIINFQLMTHATDHYFVMVEVSFKKN